MPLLDSIFSLVAPFACISCGAEGAVVCAWCAPDVFPVVPDRCYRCLKATQDSAVCHKCRKQSRLSYVWTVTTYDGYAQKTVRLLKFARVQAAAGPIVAAMQERLPYMPEDVLIVPLPAATTRMRQRGYDQAQLLARRLGQLLNRRYSRALSRVGQQRQVGSTRKQRIEQIHGAFRPLKLPMIKGAHILLVDDVLTTGASIEEVARVLKKAGAKQVDAVAFAYKQK